MIRFNLKIEIDNELLEQMTHIDDRRQSRVISQLCHALGPLSDTQASCLSWSENGIHWLWKISFRNKIFIPARFAVWSNHNIHHWKKMWIVHV